MRIHNQTTNILNDAADIIAKEGWTALDYIDRNPIDGEDICSAIARASQNIDGSVNQEAQTTALLAVTDQLVNLIGDEAASNGMYWQLLNSPYPAAALVHWQNEDGSKWGSIELIEAAVDHIHHQDMDTFTDQEDYDLSLAEDQS